MPFTLTKRVELLVQALTHVKSAQAKAQNRTTLVIRRDAESSSARSLGQKVTELEELLGTARVQQKVSDELTKLADAGKIRELRARLDKRIFNLSEVFCSSSLSPPPCNRWCCRLAFQ